MVVNLYETFQFAAILFIVIVIIIIIIIIITIIINIFIIISRVQTRTSGTPLLQPLKRPGDLRRGYT